MLQYIAKETQGECLTSFYIPRKQPIVALICTMFIIYPNAVWIPWNLAWQNVCEELGFWAFFAFHMIYFYGLFFFQLRYNVRKIGNMSFAARFGLNFIYTLVGCAAFVGLSYDLPALDISLTENGAMLPQASVCGLYLASPHAYYFSVRS